MMIMDTSIYLISLAQLASYAQTQVMLAEFPDLQQWIDVIQATLGLPIQSYIYRKLHMFPYLGRDFIVIGRQHAQVRSKPRFNS